MDVLVIGGTGYMSGPVVNALLEAGHAVTVLTRGERPLPEGVRSLKGDRKRHSEFVELMEGRPFDAVVDCICYTPEDARANLQAFAGRIGHLVMISTDFVYGPHRVLPATEDTPTRAMSEYGRKKVQCEEIFFGAFAEDGFPVTSLRPPHIMGAGGQLGTGSLLNRDPMLLDRVEQGLPIILLDGGQFLIQPVVHRDIAGAVCAVLGVEATFGRAYNMAGADCVTTREYYDIVAATLGVEAPEYLSLPSAEYVRAFPDRAPFATHRMYSMERLAADTGFRPRVSVRHAIFEMIAWLQSPGSAKPCVDTEHDLQTAALCRAFGEQLPRILG